MNTVILMSNELTTVPLKKGAYEKPERTNKNILPKKYDKVDLACSAVQLGNDGNAYIPEESISGLLGKKKSESRYIIDNKISDSDKVNVNNKPMINTTGVVAFLDKNSHQTRNSEEADLSRYGRDSLIRIGDSDQAEAIRRKIDCLVNRELPKLRKQRRVDFDEITGEPLGSGAAFHHKNNKSIHNHPFDVTNPDKGINVNKDTHEEIHRRGIMDEEELERQKDSICETVKSRKKK